MDAPTPDPSEQLRAEIQRLQTRIALLEAHLAPGAPGVAAALAEQPLWFHFVGDAIFIADAAWSIRHWNQAATQLYGWASAEAVGRPISALIAVTRYLDGDSDEGATRALLTAGSWRGTMVQHTRDGREVVVEGATRTLVDAQGAIIGYIGINRDVTARVRAEQALQRATQRLQILVDASHAFAEAEPDEAALLALVARRTANALEAGCLVHLRRADAPWLDAAICYDADPSVQADLQALFGGAPLPLDAPDPTAHVARTGQPLLSAAVDPEAIRAALPPELRPALERVRPYSQVIVPLGAHGQRLGCLAFTRHGEGLRPFTGDDLSLAQELADRVTLAITNARLYQQAQVAQQAAAEALARLDALVRSTPNGIGYLDHELRYQLVNPALAALNGLTPEEHLGHTPQELFPALASYLDPPMRQVLATGAMARDLELHSESYKDSAEPRDWLISYFPVCGAADIVTGVGVTVTDITERHAARRALERERQQLAAMLDTMQEGVIAVRPDGSLALLNQAVLAMLALDPAHPPSTLVELLLQASPQCFDARGQALKLEHGPLHRVLRGERIIGQELSLRLSGSEQEHWYLFNGTPVYDQEGTYLLGVVTGQDITELKRKELALAAQADTVSRINAELARALRFKEEFLAMIGHELRTPLNGVLGISEGLIEEIYGPLNPRQRQSQQRIIIAARRLLAILNDILDLTRIEAGDFGLELRPTDVASICEVALQRAAEHAARKGIQLQYTLAEATALAYADGRRLAQILVNLLDNAIKFTPVGGGAGLEVVGDPDTEQIRLTVWDTGIGIAEEDLERLFQPFIQLDAQLSRSYEGTGLGLSLVHRLVDLHGGSVALESAPSTGSRFTIALPWLRAGAAQPPAAEARPPWARPPRVLVADDNETTLARYVERLSQWGCVALTARTGVEALEQIRMLRPAIVLLDLQMPALDGLAVLQSVRADVALAALPIVVVTALMLPGTRRQVLAAGATRCLAKPVSGPMLLATIAELLTGADPGPE